MAELLAIPTAEGLESARLATLARLAAGRANAAKALKATRRAMRRTKAGRQALAAGRKAAAELERPSAQLALFSTQVFLPARARERFIITDSYGPEWAENYLAVRLGQLGKILERDGFRSSYNLRRWDVPGIRFSMGTRQ